MSYTLVWVRPAESSRGMTNTTQTMTLKTASRGLGIVHRLASQLFTAARLARAPPSFLGQLLQRNHRFESVEPASTFPHTVTEFPLRSSPTRGLVQPVTLRRFAHDSHPTLRWKTASKRGVCVSRWQIFEQVASAVGSEDANQHRRTE
jgi:hypothetical protein